MSQLFTTKKTVAGTYTNPQAWGEGWVSDDFVALRSLLWETLSTCSPQCILVMGDISLVMLTGIFGGVAKWRGSHLQTHKSLGEIPVIPTYSLSDMNRVYEYRFFAARDIQRVTAIMQNPALSTPPPYHFYIRPTFTEAKERLEKLIQFATDSPEVMNLSVDLETMQKHIAVIGLAWSIHDAICIPLLTTRGHYWLEEEEVELFLLLRRLLQHENVCIIGQNFNYDAQFFIRYLGFWPKCKFDTMLAQHVLYPGIPKSLDFLASMYCEYYSYWKDELNDYNKLPSNLDQYWRYNCQDVCYTYECAEVLRESLSQMNRWPQMDFLQELGWNTLMMTLRGCAINKSQRSYVTTQLTKYRDELISCIHEILGFPLNLASAPQMQKLFYTILGLPVQRNKKTKAISCDAKALAKLSQTEPIIRPLIELIEKCRSANVFINTFCLMPLDYDGRMRCSFNMAGAETFRFSSSTNVFGSGGNLQNIPKGEED
jgi:DNA polymerase I-like protein with 3'-5' exonuclease and polymerase domains